MRLVADVGGTNCRLALAEGDAVRLDSLQSFANEEHDSFLSVAESYLARTGVRVSEVAVAVAGPVGQGHARLTNRDWDFDVAEMSARLGAPKVGLLNDLKALGYSVPHLAGASLSHLHEAPADNRGQSLVMGIGTGFNVSPVIRVGARVTCPDAEAGHISLPTAVAARIEAMKPGASAAFPTVEHVFSGRGVLALFRAVTGISDLPARDIATSTAPEARAFVEEYARMVADLARDFLLLYLPTDGIYFSGGVARAVLAAAPDAFREVFGAPVRLNQPVTAPVYIIEDDAAALRGCAGFPLD